MSRRHAFISLFLIPAVLLLGGFLLSCDTSTQVKIAYKKVAADDDNAADDDQTPPDETAPDPPIVDPVHSPTGLDYQSIRGTAEPLATVRVTLDQVNMDTQVLENGEFCIKVQLKENATNELEIQAIDAAENKSTAVAATIVQERKNLALTSAPTASSTSHSKPENTPNKAIDGKKFTWWENTTQPWFPEANYPMQWLSLELDKEYYLDLINLFWGKDTVGKFEYATKGAVYVNDLAEIEKLPHEVSPAQLADYGYVKVANINQDPDADIESNTFDLSAEPQIARWVFLVLSESNQPGVLPGDQGQTLYSYEVAELEVYGFDQPDNGCE